MLLKYVMYTWAARYGAMSPTELEDDGYVRIDAESEVIERYAKAHRKQRRRRVVHGCIATS